MNSLSVSRNDPQNLSTVAQGDLPAAAASATTAAAVTSATAAAAVSTAAATATVTAAAATTTAAARRSFLGFVDPQRSTFKVLSVESIDCFLGSLVGHRHKAEATASTSLAIGQNNRIIDLTVLAKNLFQLFRRDGPSQISHIHLHRYYSSKFRKALSLGAVRDALIASISF